MKEEKQGKYMSYPQSLQNHITQTETHVEIGGNRRRKKWQGKQTYRSRHRERKRKPACRREQKAEKISMTDNN